MEGPILEVQWPSVFYHKNPPLRQGYLPPPLLEAYILTKLQILKIVFVIKEISGYIAPWERLAEMDTHTTEIKLVKMFLCISHGL